MTTIPFSPARSANPLKMAIFIILFLLSAPVGFAQAYTSGREESSGLRLATFDVDATPPLGNQMTYNPVIGFWDLGLRARGIILLGAGQPVVLCSVDWIGIANESQDEFKRVMADAAGTVPERVAVHTVHVHDAPVCDFGAEEYLMEAGYNPLGFGSSYTRHVMIRIGEAIRTSVKQAHTGQRRADSRHPFYHLRRFCFAGRTGRPDRSHGFAYEFLERRPCDSGIKLLCCSSSELLPDRLT